MPTYYVLLLTCGSNFPGKLIDGHFVLLPQLHVDEDGLKAVDGIPEKRDEGGGRHQLLHLQEVPLGVEGKDVKLDSLPGLPLHLRGLERLKHGELPALGGHGEHQIVFETKPGGREIKQKEFLKGEV